MFGKTLERKIKRRNSILTRSERSQRRIHNEKINKIISINVRIFSLFLAGILRVLSPDELLFWENII